MTSLVSYVFLSGRSRTLGRCLRIFIVRRRTSPHQYLPPSITVTQEKQTTPKTVKWRKVKNLSVFLQQGKCLQLKSHQAILLDILFISGETKSIGDQKTTEQNKDKQLGDPSTGTPDLCFIQLHLFCKLSSMRGNHYLMQTFDYCILHTTVSLHQAVLATVLHVLKLWDMPVFGFEYWYDNF